MKRILLFLIATLIVTGCEYDFIKQINIPIDTTKVISYSNDLQPLFNADCIGCHSSGNVSPDLSLNKSYNELLTGSPKVCKGFSTYIDKLNPPGSLIYVKLFSNPPCGSVMPTTTQWSQDKTNKVLLWIKQGAPNN